MNLKKCLNLKVDVEFLSFQIDCKKSTRQKKYLGCKAHHHMALLNFYSVHTHRLLDSFGF